MVYYHATPKRNLRSILRRGLSTSGSLALGMLAEDTRGKVFLARDKAEALWNVLQGDSLSFPDEPPAGARFWALLRVNLPDGWPLDQDSYGFLYSESRIPPEYISVEEVDVAGERTLRGKVRDEVYRDSAPRYFSDAFWSKAEKQGWV